MDGLVMRKFDGVWVPVVHCGACLEPVEPTGLILWDVGSDRTVVTPSVVCGPNCAEQCRALVPNLTLDQMPIAALFMAMLAGTATTDVVHGLIERGEVMRAIQAAEHGGPRRAEAL